LSIRHLDLTAALVGRLARMSNPRDRLAANGAHP
jgi:hypothetical protein